MQLFRLVFSFVLSCPHSVRSTLMCSCASFPLSNWLNKSANSIPPITVANLEAWGGYVRASPRHLMTRILDHRYVCFLKLVVTWGKCLLKGLHVVGSGRTCETKCAPGVRKYIYYQWSYGLPVTMLNDWHRGPATLTICFVISCSLAWISNTHPITCLNEDPYFNNGTALPSSGKHELLHMANGQMSGLECCHKWTCYGLNYQQWPTTTMTFSDLYLKDEIREPHSIL